MTINRLANYYTTKFGYGRKDTFIMAKQAVRSTKSHKRRQEHHHAE